MATSVITTAPGPAPEPAPEPASTSSQVPDYSGRFLQDVSFSPPDHDEAFEENPGGVLIFRFGDHDTCVVNIPRDNFTVSEEKTKGTDYYKIGDIYIQVYTEKQAVFIYNDSISLDAACRDADAFKSLTRAIEEL